VSVLKEIAHLADVAIGIEVELGRKTMTVAEILELSPGSIIKLPRSAGENIDIRAGGHLFGSGEIVVVDQRFGARITDFKEEE
jgi:flagellar motor switch protein FliN/FliY